jgi:hypothetical protein
MNSVATLTNSNTALDRILADIAAQATNMVLGAHIIGSRLIEARDILGDDAAFGAWRKECIEPLGISLRTAQRMQNIAEKFTLETLPEVGLSVLYMLASDGVQPQLQEALIERAVVGAQCKQPLTARAANTWVAKANQGKATFVDVKKDSQSVLAEAKAEATVVLPAYLDADPVAPKAPAPAGPVAVRDWEAEAKEYACNVRRKLKSVANCQRSLFLFALSQELRKSGLLDIDPSLSVQVNGSLKITPAK